MSQWSKEYLITILNQFNKVESIEDDWEFVKKILTDEQSNILLAWLNDKMDGSVAKEKIKAVQWLMDYISRIKKLGSMAKDELGGIVKD